MPKEKDLPKLRPCPFCNNGTLHVYHPTEPAPNNNCWVSCRECYSLGPAKENVADAVMAWNTRPHQKNFKPVPASP